jgi:hypothetical protein
MKLLKRYDLYVVFGVGLLVSLTFMFFDQTHELGTNLFTEISSVALTVFIINKILERKERQKRIAIDQRILRETQSIIASYFSIWKHLVWQYFPNEKIENEQDFLALYPRLVKASKVNEQFEVVSIHHPESWKLIFHHRTIKECFKNYYDALNASTQLFINDFKIFLEPELLDYLLDVMECDYFKNIYMMCYEEGTEQILMELDQDVNRLDSYLNPDDTKHVQQFLELLRYSKKLKNTIAKFTPVTVELYQFKKYFTDPTKFA